MIVPPIGARYVPAFLKVRFEQFEALNIPRYGCRFAYPPKSTFRMIILSQETVVAIAYFPVVALVVPVNLSIYCTRSKSKFAQVEGEKVEAVTLKVQSPIIFLHCEKFVSPVERAYVIIPVSTFSNS